MSAVKEMACVLLCVVYSGKKRPASALKEMACVYSGKKWPASAVKEMVCVCSGENDLFIQ